MESEYDSAEINVNQIDSFIKDLCNQGKLSIAWISKSSIRVRFRLPKARSVIVWELLRKKGYHINFHSIRVPKEYIQPDPQDQRDVQKFQKEVGEQKKESELERLKRLREDVRS